jgi:hypothetical protein
MTGLTLGEKTMMALFDMLNNAQNGDAMKDIASKFGLDQEQMTKTVEALMPAFSTGLKRNTQTPDAMGDFMKALSSGNHSEYFQQASKAYSPEGVQDGNNILGHLFGSKEVSRAVAAQAEAASGVGQDIIKQLLPILANTLMGGMFNQTNEKMQGLSGSGSGNVFGDIISQMMKGASGNQAGSQSAGSNPLGDLIGGFLGGRTQGSAAQDNPLGKMMEGMMGGAKGQDNPLGQMMEGMFGGAKTQTPSASEPKANPYDDMFGKMFDTGRAVQDDYQKNVDGIFDQFLGGMNKK